VGEIHVGENRKGEFANERLVEVPPGKTRLLVGKREEQKKTKTNEEDGKRERR